MRINSLCLLRCRLEISQGVFRQLQKCKHRMIAIVGLHLLTRFNPDNAHVCGLSRHGAYVGSGELDSDQTKAEGHEVSPMVRCSVDCDCTD
jgi:hypothetical protein